MNEELEKIIEVRRMPDEFNNVHIVIENGQIVKIHVDGDLEKISDKDLYKISEFIYTLKQKKNDKKNKRRLY